MDGSDEDGGVLSMHYAVFLQELETDNNLLFQRKRPQFTSLFLLQNGIKHIKSAPYHPTSNEGGTGKDC